jgi:hypothetical protein
VIRVLSVVAGTIGGALLTGAAAFDGTAGGRATAAVVGLSLVITGVSLIIPWG